MSFSCTICSTLKVQARVRKTGFERCRLAFFFRNACSNAFLFPFELFKNRFRCSSEPWSKQHSFRLRCWLLDFVFGLEIALFRCALRSQQARIRAIAFSLPTRHPTSGKNVRRGRRRPDLLRKRNHRPFPPAWRVADGELPNVDAATESFPGGRNFPLVRSDILLAKEAFAARHPIRHCHHRPEQGCKSELNLNYCSGNQSFPVPVSEFRNSICNLELEHDAAQRFEGDVLLQRVRGQ